MKRTMRVYARRTFAFCVAVMLCLPACAGALASILPVGAAEEVYVAPAYLVDFTQLDNVVACSGAYHLMPERGDDGMYIRFTDSGNGMCDDPYLSLALPGSVDATKYHYMALLVRTNKQDLRGELRFRTDTTGNDYPCQFFSYEKTNDWQLIIIDITNKNTVNYAGAASKFEGSFTNLRLDMFNNNCPADTEYVIKGYGLYDNRADAETFIHFTPTTAGGSEELPDVDYASFWRGEAFANPANSTRMRWVTYGFESENTTPIDNFLAQGFGGVVSNVLFEKNYLLNDRQFEIVGSVYDYANKQGMTTWIYDEYQWPSGKAFGQVLEGHDEYQATGIAHRVISGRSGETATYACSGPDIRIVRVDIDDKNGRRTLSAADGVGEREVTFTPEGRWSLHVYVMRYSYEGVEDRNDFTTLRHVDLLNKEAVARFIELTHQRYKDKMGENFKNVEAFFTDEPQLGNRAMTGYAVWTPGLEDMFKETYGYELDIADLYEGDDADARRVRMQYLSLVAKLFKEAYIDQISAWCEANGTASSGHLLFEECMTDQIETYGGDFLQIIGGMTIPGVDLLHVTPDRLLTKTHIGNAVGTRYVVSAAKNQGKDRVMVEYNPDAANALSDAAPLSECISGVTLTRLLGTTDYNVINPQMNLTTSGYRELNTYVGRLNTLLEGAVECGELAVFYPIATVQALYDADTGHTTETNGRSQAYRLDTEYQQMCVDMLTSQYLYTVIDDVALQNATVATDGCLCVGDGAYRAIVMPMTQYISAKAMETLVTFKAAGGTVIFVGDTPVYGLTAAEDARVAAAMEALAGSPTYTKADSTFISDLSKYVSRRVQVTAAKADQQKAILTGDFSTEDRDIVYLANTIANDSTCTAVYTDGYTGKVTVYYPRSAMIETVEVGADGLTVTIPAYEAVLVVREDAKGLAHLTGHTAYVPEENEETTEAGTDAPLPDTLPSDGTTAETGSNTLSTTGAETDAEKTGGCASSLIGGGALTALAVAAYAVHRRKEN